MKQDSFIMLVLFFLICSFSACEKEYEPTGRFGFVFKVDREEFKAKSDDWKKKAVYSAIENDSVAISGLYSIGSTNLSVGFWIRNFSGPGVYQLNSRTLNYGEYNRGFIHAYTDQKNSGEVVITHYIPEKKIVAGTFSFTALVRDTGEMYEITDGRFDIFYGTFNN